LAAAVATGIVAWLPAAAQDCRLSDLGWMAGTWRNDAGASQSEERWTLASGARVMGSAWSLHADRPGGVLEISTIQQDGKAVVLRLRHFDATLAHAREAQDGPMVFTASRCDAASAVFDGEGPQTGEHMTYRRDGDRMSFVGEFLHSGQPVRVELAFKRAAP
jgi:hypothetical protein